METKHWSDFVEYSINKKSYGLACAFMIYGHLKCFESTQIALAIGLFDTLKFSLIVRQ